MRWRGVGWYAVLILWWNTILYLVWRTGLLRGSGVGWYGLSL